MIHKNGVEEARTKYNEVLKPSVLSLTEIIYSLIWTKQFKNIIKVSRNFYKRNKDPLVLLVIIMLPYIISRISIRCILNIIKKYVT